MTQPPEVSLTRVSETSGATTRTQLTTAAEGGAVVGFVVLVTRALRWVRDAFEVAVDWASRTITPAGWLVCGAAVLGIGLGGAFGWVEWLVAGIAALAMLLISIPFLFGARAYDVSVALAHERTVAGGEVQGEILVHNRGGASMLPGRIDLPVGDGLIEIGVPLLRSRHTVAQPVEIPTPRRGVIPVGPATAVRSDPIGLLRREHAWEDEVLLYVHPRTVPVPTTSAGLVRDLEGQPTRRLVDADMSFHAIREYAPGDTRRQIHWKSTAKTGQLMVRQFEESRRSRMAVVLGVDEEDFLDADEFELAVSAAASLSVQALRDGRDLDVVIGAEVPRAVRGRIRAIRALSASRPRALLDAFCDVDALDSTMPIEGVCRLAAEAHTALSIVFVVCGSRVTNARRRQAALSFGDDTAVVMVRCDERAHPRTQVLGSQAVLTIGVLEDLAALMVRGAAQ